MAGWGTLHLSGTQFSSEHLATSLYWFLIAGMGWVKIPQSWLATIYGYAKLDTGSRGKDRQ